MFYNIVFASNTHISTPCIVHRQDNSKYVPSKKVRKGLILDIGRFFVFVGWKVFEIIAIKYVRHKKLMFILESKIEKTKAFFLELMKPSFTMILIFIP